MQKIPDSLLRIIILISVSIVVVVALRVFVLPADWTDMTTLKERATQTEMSRPVKYAGSQACRDCHDAEPAALADGRHSMLSCETCHGAAQAHIEDMEIKPQAPRERDFCPVCHAFDASRPTGFAQINPVSHNPMQACISCHDPHAPRPPVTPHDCSACHAEIVRTKAVSRHARLECTQCHETPEAHKEVPRLHQPTKPDRREFCAQCHGAESTVAEAHKIDMDSHGGRYLCWQCHYPHLPEGR